MASNVDSQRLFDEEVDGLGFQLKEWPWHWGRDQLLADLCQNRKRGLRSPLHRCRQVAEQMRRLRRRLDRLRTGVLLRARPNCRPTPSKRPAARCTAGETEREIAGQLSHRLMHRGVLPLHVGVAVDGRSRLLSQFRFHVHADEHYAAADGDGPQVWSGRDGQPRQSVSATCRPNSGKDHNAVCRVSASYLASTWPDAVPREILLAGRRIYLISGYEHEWQLAPARPIDRPRRRGTAADAADRRNVPARLVRHLERQRRARLQLRYLPHHRAGAEDRSRRPRFGRSSASASRAPSSSVPTSCRIAIAAPRMAACGFAITSKNCKAASGKQEKTISSRKALHPGRWFPRLQSPSLSASSIPPGP